MLSYVVSVVSVSSVPTDCLLDETSPVPLLKACKNPAELQGMRACHVRDAVAVVEFLAWLDETVAAAVAIASGNTASSSSSSSSRSINTCVSSGTSSVGLVDELTIDQVLTAMRREDALFVDRSFDTIAALNEHGAIMHYR
jgi:Xaa-Pro aminopeptidase